MGNIKQLAEIAALVIFQEWSALKNNQRLDFFVLLYQDKRTKKIRSDFLSDNSKKQWFQSLKKLSIKKGALAPFNRI